MPTMEPRIVMRLRTTSKIGVAKSPGGRPTSAHVPRGRSIPIDCRKASLDAAVTSTPCAPPMSRCSSLAGSIRASSAISAPSERAKSSLSSPMSTAATRMPMA